MSIQLELPVIFSAKIFFTNGTDRIFVTYELPDGLYPREADIMAGLNEVAAEVQRTVGAEWRLMNYSEFATKTLSEKLGMDDDMPAQAGNWSKPFEAKRED